MGDYFHGLYRFTGDGTPLDTLHVTPTWGGLAVDGDGLLYVSGLRGLEKRSRGAIYIVDNHHNRVVRFAYP